MDAECAFCGRASAATCQVVCEDCRSQHSACAACAEEVTSTQTELYHLVPDRRP